jgi:hypothetical protein
MRETVGQQDLRSRRQLGNIARQRVAHQNRAGQFCMALLQHLVPRQNSIQVQIAPDLNR